jgi:hypothetical protein
MHPPSKLQWLTIKKGLIIICKSMTIGCYSKPSSIIANSILKSGMQYIFEKALNKHYYKQVQVIENSIANNTIL